MHWLYLSPHLDDVVLGCGGTIASRVAAGDRVTVASIFTAASGDPGAPERVRSLYRERRQEDIVAATVLGHDAVHLGLPDAPFRSTHYRDFATIAFSDPCSPEARAATRTVVVRLEDLLATLRPDRLMAPLGVGGHIDHRIVRQASSQLPSDVPVGYYEDRPYAFVPGAIAARWLELGARPADGMDTRGQTVPASWERLPFLANYMADDPDPAGCLERLHEMDVSLSEGTRRAGCWALDGRLYRRSCRRLDEGLAGKLVEGISAYVSQLSDLFCEREEIRDSLDSPGEAAKERIEGLYRHHALLPGEEEWYEPEWTEEGS